MLGKLDIKRMNGDGIGYEVYVNDKAIRNIRSLTLNLEPEELPEVVLRVTAKPEISSMANIMGILDMSEGLTDAINTLKFVTMVDKDIQEGFIASIRSALDDIERSGVKDHHIAAQFIYNRVFGD